MNFEAKLQIVFTKAIKSVGFANFKATPIFGSNHSAHRKRNDRKAA